MEMFSCCSFLFFLCVYVSMAEIVCANKPERENLLSCFGFLVHERKQKKRNVFVVLFFARISFFLFIQHSQENKEREKKYQAGI